MKEEKKATFVLQEEQTSPTERQPIPRRLLLFAPFLCSPTERTGRAQLSSGARFCHLFPPRATNSGSGEAKHQIVVSTCSHSVRQSLARPGLQFNCRFTDAQKKKSIRNAAASQLSYLCISPTHLRRPAGTPVPRCRSEPKQPWGLKFVRATTPERFAPSLPPGSSSSTKRLEGGEGAAAAAAQAVRGNAQADPPLPSPPLRAAWERASTCAPPIARAARPSRISRVAANLCPGSACY